MSGQDGSAAAAHETINLLHTVRTLAVQQIPVRDYRSPNIRFSTVQHAQRRASADPPILRVIVYRISTACSICSFAMVALVRDEHG
jgi:hypothetical protein